MKYRANFFSRLALLGLLAGPGVAAWAQGLQVPPAGAPLGRSAPVASSSQGVADFIVVVVNSEPVTNSQVRAEIQKMREQIQRAGGTPPDARELTRVALDRLIVERAQLQQARELGIRVEESAIDQAQIDVARQNNFDREQLLQQLARDGVTLAQFREQLRDQIAVARLREREVNSKLKVTDAEVDQYISDQQSGSDPAGMVLNMAQILIAVPDDATPAQVATLQSKAQAALTRARAGEDFGKLARELSDASDRAAGGQLGVRTGDRYPPLFVQAAQNLKPGAVADLVRSGAGFHVLKLIEKRASGLPNPNVTQTRARHILLRPSGPAAEPAAIERLRDFKRRIETGQTDFATLAKESSQDGSSASGGDLGWAGPGQFVPEFESVMDRLAPGQISDPLVSRFGVHLIQVNERRVGALSEREIREAVRNGLRDQKLEEATNTWLAEVRGRAYVEFREAPL